MFRSLQVVAASLTVVATASWLYLWMISRARRTRSIVRRTSGAYPGRRQPVDDLNQASGVQDRRDAEDEQAFSLYMVGESDIKLTFPPMKLSQHVYSLLKTFDVDPVRGFLPSVDPLRRLPQAEFQAWEAMADALPSLLAVGQARKPLESLPELPIDALTCHRERMRAFLLLSVFAHASVWGNPKQPQDTIPRCIAIPLSSLAAAEGMPPLLTHTSLVLHNWHRLDPSGPIRTENLACNCRFLGGLDETWFYISTVEIEARGGGVFGALLQAQHSIAELDSASIGGEISLKNSRAHSDAKTVAAGRVVLEALGVVRRGILSMREALSRMPVGCHPMIFYHRVRPFLSGWKANPTLPDGVLYEAAQTRHHTQASHKSLESLSNQNEGEERVLTDLSPHSREGAVSYSSPPGIDCTHPRRISCALDILAYQGVSWRRKQYYGGSAAQSTLFPALDAALEVSHSKHSSNAFLLEMRDYMPPGHRRLLEHLSNPACPSIRRFVENFPDRLKLDSDVDGGEEVVVTTGQSEEGGSGGKIIPECEVASAAEALREAYNACLRSLCDFRSTHLGIVRSYILSQQKGNVKAGEASSREDFAGGKGTGGTPLIDFLKPLKEDARVALLDT